MLPCPCCHRPLRTVIESGIEIDVCDDCESVWLDAGELNQLAARHQVSVTGNPHATIDLAEALLADHELGDLCCPRCETTKFCDLTYRKIQISRCEGCAGIYIDHESLDRLRLADDRVTVSQRSEASANRKAAAESPQDEASTATQVAVDVVGNGLFELLVQLLCAV